jgi:4-amino-4-deoxy-L-arabinose transferase-like glycosyltransferase
LVIPTGFFATKAEKRFSKHVFIAVVLITIIAIGLRLGYVSVTTIVPPIRADAKQYVDYARNLLVHGVFSLQPEEQNPVPDSYRSPGYPVFISLIMRFAKENSSQALRVVQAVIGGTMALLTYLVGTFFLPAWAALVAGSLVALSPHLVVSTGYVLTETLFGFLLLLGLLAFFLYLKRPSPGRCIASGICFGTAYLTNELAFLIVIVICIAVAAKNKKSRIGLDPSRSLQVLYILVVFLIFPVSWSVRNHINVPASSPQRKERMLATLTHGTYPDFVYKDTRFKYYPYKEDPRQPEFGRSFEHFMNIFLERFRARPLRYLIWYTIEKPYYLWSWDILQGQGDVYIYPVQDSLYASNRFVGLSHFVMKVLHPGVLLLALISLPLFLWTHRKKYLEHSRTGPKVIMSVLWAATGMYAVFASWPRYSIPLRPELYLCAVWSLIALLSVLNASGEKP